MDESQRYINSVIRHMALGIPLLTPPPESYRAHHTDLDTHNYILRSMLTHSHGHKVASIIRPSEEKLAMNTVREVVSAEELTMPSPFDGQNLLGLHFPFLPPRQHSALTPGPAVERTPHVNIDEPFNERTAKIPVDKIAIPQPMDFYVPHLRSIDMDITSKDEKIINNLSMADLTTASHSGSADANAGPQMIGGTNPVEVTASDMHRRLFGHVMMP